MHLNYRRKHYNYNYNTYNSCFCKAYRYPLMLVEIIYKYFMHIFVTCLMSNLMRLGKVRVYYLLFGKISYHEKLYADFILLAFRCLVKCRSYPDDCD